VSEAMQSDTVDASMLFLMENKLFMLSCSYLQAHVKKKRTNTNVGGEKQAGGYLLDHF
jgi:hypothetical protein